MPRQAKRPTAPEIRDRNTRDLLGRPGLAGLARIGGIGSRGGGGRSVLADIAPIDEQTAAGSGQLLILSATAAPIASGGDYVTFDTQTYRRGFADGIQADGQTVIWPASAVGAIQVELAWDTYAGGGTVELEVDGTVPPFGLLGTGASGQCGVKRRGVDIAEGSFVKLKVTQTSGAPQTCDVLVELQVQDPTDEALATRVWKVRHFADSDFDPAGLGHPATLALISPENVSIPMAADARWPGSGVVTLGRINLDAGFVFQHTDTDGNTVRSDSVHCHVTAHDGNPTNIEGEHQNIAEIDGPGWVLAWETTEPAGAGAGASDFNDVYTYIWASEAG